MAFRNGKKSCLCDGQAIDVAIDIWRLDVRLLGAIDGVNDTFFTPQYFINEGDEMLTIAVYRNGQRLAIDENFTASESVTGNGFDTVTFLPGDIPEVGDDLLCDYVTDDNDTGFGFVPAAPANVAAVSSTGQNDISWDASVGALSYNLHFKLTPGVIPGDPGVTTITGVTSPYTHIPLTNGVTVYYAVTAVSFAGESPLSAEVFATPLAVPANPSATAGDEQNEIDWDTVSGGDEAVSYTLFWDTSPGITTSSNAIPGVTPPFLHTGLTNEQTYYYRVQASVPSGVSGLSVEVDATPIAPFNLLAEVDFTQLPAQVFPATATTVFPGLTATSIFLCDETAPSNLVDLLGGEQLAPSGAVLHDRNAVGLPSGGNLYGKRCIEVAANSSSFTSTNTTFAEVGASDSWAGVWIFRVHSQTLGAKYLYQKGTTGVTHNLRTLSAGTLRWTISDGTNTTFISSPQVVTDGGWHQVTAVINRATSTIYIYQDGYPVVTGSIAGFGSLANGIAFRLCVGVNNNSISTAYFATFEDANAEGITASHHNTLWQQGKLVTSPQVTYSRISGCSSHAADDGVNGVLVAKWAPQQFPHGVSSSFSHASKLGGLVERTKTNLLAQSENGTSWTRSSASVSTNISDAPDGTRTADRLNATGADGYASLSGTTTIGQTYTGSVYVNTTFGSPVAGRIALHDGVSEIASQSFTATSLFQRVSVSGVATTGTTEVRVHVTSSGQNLVPWGWQLEIGKLSSYIQTYSTVEIRGAPSILLANPGGNTYLQSVRGEIQATVVLNSGTTNPAANYERALFDADASVGDNDRLTIFTTQSGATQEARAEILDNSAVLAQAPVLSPIPDWSVENLVRLRWNSTDPIDGFSENADIIVNGSRGAGSAGDWVAGVNAVNLFIGSLSTGLNQLDGLISKLAIYDAPGPDVLP